MELGIHCVLEGSGKQSMVFTVFEKAQTVKVFYCVFKGAVISQER